VPIVLKSRDEIAIMRESGRILAEVLQHITERLRPGLVEKELDEIARREFKKRGVIPTFLGYAQPPYPASICVSVNDEIVHGIPGKRELSDGDIVSIDIGARTRGSWRTWRSRLASATCRRTRSGSWT
jgi:methionyl aminopeptidase